MDKFTVIRDTREKVGGWWFNEDSKCSGTVIDTVKVGDYTILGLEDQLCIERKKSIKEFANNCGEPRFDKQITAMAEAFDEAHVIFEFSKFDVEIFPKGSGIPKHKLKFVRMKPATIFSKISLMKKLGINVHFCKNAIDAADKAYSIMVNRWYRD